MKSNKKSSQLPYTFIKKPKKKKLNMCIFSNKFKKTGS